MEYKSTVPKKYFIPGFIGPPIVFGLIHQSFIFGLLTFVIGFFVTLILLRLLNIILGAKLSRHLIGHKMNFLVMILIYCWVGIYLPSFF